MYVGLLFSELGLRLAVVRIGNDMNHMMNKMCGEITTCDIEDAVDGHTNRIEIMCKNMTGRFISVELPESMGAKRLTLCEVEAYMDDMHMGR